MYIKFEIFIPRSDSPKLIDALAEGGFLREKNYDYAYSHTEVMGHFKPLEGANPHIGNIDEIEEVQELKIEFRVFRKDAKKAYECIIKNHPYEVPVINAYELLDIEDIK